MNYKEQVSQEEREHDLSEGGMLIARLRSGSGR